MWTLGRAPRRPPPTVRAMSIDASSMRGKHVDNMFLLSSSEIRAVLDIAAGLKAKLRRTDVVYRPLVRSALRPLRT